MKHFSSIPGYLLALAMLASCAERNNSDDVGEREPPDGFLPILAAFETPVSAGASDCDFEETPLRLRLFEGSATDVETLEVHYRSSILTVGRAGLTADVYIGACFEGGEIRLATWVAESGPFGLKEASVTTSALIDISGLPFESGDTVAVFNEPSGSRIEVELP